MVLIAMKTCPTFDIENETGFDIVAGVDEAGRGPLCGPVVAAEEMKTFREQWKDSVLICQDISSGVVPMEAQLRQWRNANGRLCQYLAGQADQVIRVFCGLEQRLK